MSSNAARLQLYLDAEARILAGQTVRFGDRELRRADLAEVRKAIADLSAAISREGGRRGRFSQADFGGRT
ncbi:MAG TPA: primosomal replication protein PriB/PriC domain protein [Luteimonas sp.]